MKGVNKNSPDQLALAGTTLLINGIVGSRAYGLDNDASDTDTLAVYAEEPEFFLGCRPPTPAASPKSRMWSTATTPRPTRFRSSCAWR